MSEVDVTTLKQFREPIRAALQQYGELTEGVVEFEPDVAADLRELSETFTLAKSISGVWYLGKLAAILEVIVLAPGGGTGDESHRTLASMGEGSFGHYLRTSAVLPRSNTDIHTQAHLAIGSLPEDAKEVVPFAGSIEAVGFTRDESRLTRIATLGHDSYSRLTDSDPVNYQPLSTIAVGYDKESNRLGGVQALYNNSPANTVAFGLLSVLASAPKKRRDECREIFRLLNTQEPQVLPPDVVARPENQTTA